MSLRGKNTLVPTSGPSEKTGSLRTAAHQTVARPTSAGMTAILKASANVSIRGRGKLGFVIDATGSRESTWSEAQRIQAEMFNNTASYGSLELKLVHYGGNKITSHEWQHAPEGVVRAMAGVECVSGNTQIVDSLDKFANEKDGQGANSIIVVGDCFEEDLSDLRKMAERLALKNVKVFTFLEGSNHTAEEAFKMLSETTGGRFAHFGSNMPLADLCEGVARLTVGGRAALEGIRNIAVRQLLLAGPSR